MNALEFLKACLKEKGYDGLVSDTGECGCGLDDLAPCGESFDRCFPGYAGPDPSGECDTLIYHSKEAADVARREGATTMTSVEVGAEGGRAMSEPKKCPKCGKDVEFVESGRWQTTGWWELGGIFHSGRRCAEVRLAQRTAERDAEKAGREKAEAGAIAAEENASQQRGVADQAFFRAEQAEAHAKNQRTEIRQLHRQISLLKTQCGAFSVATSMQPMNGTWFACCLWKKECGSMIAMLAALEVSESRTEKETPCQYDKLKSVATSAHARLWEMRHMLSKMPDDLLPVKLHQWRQRAEKTMHKLELWGAHI